MSTITNQEKAAPEKVWIEVDPISFDGHGETKFMTSLDLAKLFNAFFRNFLVDYEGCFVMPKPGVIDRNETYVELSVYLTNKQEAGSNKMKSLTPVNNIDPKTATAPQRILNLNSRAKQKVYSITEDSKGLFESLSYNGKWDADKMAIEQVDNANRNMVYVKVLNIDPVKILKKIYGSRIDGEEFEYRISPVKMVGPNNYMMRIERLNENNMKKLAEDLGFVQPNANNFPIVR